MVLTTARDCKVLALFFYPLVFLSFLLFPCYDSLPCSFSSFESLGLFFSLLFPYFVSNSFYLFCHFHVLSPYPVLFLHSAISLFCLSTYSFSSFCHFLDCLYQLFLFFILPFCCFISPPIPFLLSAILFVLPLSLVPFPHSGISLFCLSTYF